VEIDQDKLQDFWHQASLAAELTGIIYQLDDPCYKRETAREDLLRFMRNAELHCVIAEIKKV
jgi:hypothetical protein